MPTVQHKRGTRSALNTIKNDSQLVVGQIYFITDENRIAIATANNSYAEFSNTSELFSGSYTDLTNKPTIPTALSNLTKDINFDDRYYTETEINLMIGDIETLLAAL